MKVLILGNTATEHALALSLSLSKHINKIYCCPGNPGISEIAECVSINLSNTEEILKFIKEADINIVIPCNSQLIAEGIVDRLRLHNVNVFGPTRDTAKIEWSKYFAREFMLRRRISSPRYAAFDKKEFALAYAKAQRLPFIVKADGITNSRGVTIVNSHEGAVGAINACFEGRFGEEGKTVLIEEAVEGLEVSISTICDGESYALLPTTKKYNKLFDNNTGPTTEGVGAISPYPGFSKELLARIENEIIKPTIYGMKEEGRPYTGFLNFEIILDKNGQPYVIDINTSLDAIIASSLLLLECDLFEVIWQAQKGDLVHFKGLLPSAEMSQNAVVLSAALSSEGYPGVTASNLPIRFQMNIERGKFSQLVDKNGSLNGLNAKFILFHNNTNVDDSNNLVTGNDRIFIGTVLSDRLDHAREALYNMSQSIEFPGKLIRGDLGQ